jgi:hypothetical protein
MTELLSQARLQEMASSIGEPRRRSSRPILVARWEIDAATGRPVCRWEIEPQAPEEGLFHGGAR